MQEGGGCLGLAQNIRLLDLAAALLIGKPLRKRRVDDPVGLGTVSTPAGGAPARGGRLIDHAGLFAGPVLL